MEKSTKNRIVIYHSKYGATKSYAEHIANELHCDVVKINSKLNLDQYDQIIIGSPLYAGTPTGLKKLSLRDQDVFIFLVGLSHPVENLDIFEGAMDKLNPTIKEQVRDALFLSGGMDINKLNFIHKFIMKMVSKNQGSDISKPINHIDFDQTTDFITKIKNSD